VLLRYVPGQEPFGVATGAMSRGSLRLHAFASGPGIFTAGREPLHQDVDPTTLFVFADAGGKGLARESVRTPTNPNQPAIFLECGLPKAPDNFLEIEFLAELAHIRQLRHEQAVDPERASDDETIVGLFPRKYGPWTKKCSVSSPERTSDSTRRYSL